MITPDVQARRAVVVTAPGVQGIHGCPMTGGGFDGWVAAITVRAVSDAAVQ